jgi:lysophospholipase L1-like esterase
MKKFNLIISFLLIDLLLSQFFLLKILENDILNAHKESFENRIFNKDYNYTFKKQVKFKSQYEGNIYTISTNDLGFRDNNTLPLDRNKEYSIIIGDSFVEGVGLEYEETIVGILNKNLENDNFKFLNAGVASYSSYIYLKKIKKIINENNDLSVKNVIVFLDKSDVSDDEFYLSKPLFFPKYPKGKFIFQRKIDFYKDLKEFSFWRFYTKQTISGKILKLITDKVENFFSNIKKRSLVSKKLNKSFFEVSNSEIRAIKSINSTQRITNWYKGENWKKKTKKNIQFSVDNLKSLKKFLDKRNINLTIVLYPWPFEIDDKKIGKKYLEFITPLLNKINIKNIVIYEDFLKGNIYENISKNYLYNDIHYNKNGNEIIANKLINDFNK